MAVVTAGEVDETRAARRILSGTGLVTYLSHVTEGIYDF